MCAFCGEMTALFEGIEGNLLCITCFRQEEVEYHVDVAVAHYRAMLDKTLDHLDKLNKLLQQRRQSEPYIVLLKPMMKGRTKQPT